MINCSDGDDDLSNESSLSTRKINRWQQVFRSSLRPREEEFKIIMTETNRRIARKACRRKSTYTFFEKWKAMKSKATFSNKCKNDLDINSCDEWLFWLSFSLLVFEEEIKLSAATLSAAQNNLISKHHLLICLIAFRNSNIIFKMFALIFFMNDLNVLRLNN